MPSDRFDPDPLGLISAFLATGADRPGAADPVFLAWLVSLDADLDPAIAAAALLAGRPAAGMPGQRLLGLLHDTSHWPRASVAAFTAARPSVRENRP